MNNKTKFYTAVLIVMLVGVSILLVGRFNGKATSAEKELVTERFTRMSAEENLEKANTTIKSMGTEVARLQNKITGLEKTMEQLKSINDNLKSQLDKIMVLKDDLDKKIKDFESIAGQAAGTVSAALPSASGAK